MCPDEIANVTIKLTMDDLLGLASVTPEPAYVYLVCDSLNFVKAAKTENILPLSFSPGYILSLIHI